MSAVLNPRESVCASSYFGGRSVGQPCADDPVVYRRLRPAVPCTVSGLFVSNAHETVVRAERVEPCVVCADAACFLPRLQRVGRLCLYVPSYCDLVSFLVRSIDLELELCPYVFQHSRLLCAWGAASSGDVSVYDDHFRPIREDAHSSSL